MSFSFEHFLLLENQQRLDYLKQNFKNRIPEKIIDEIISTDPSDKHIYTQWIMNQFLKNTIKTPDFQNVKMFLNDFDSVKNYLPIDQKDINKYKLNPGTSFKQQSVITNFYSQLKEIREENGLDQYGNFIGGDIVKRFSKDNFIVRVKNEKFCRSKSVESGWCIKNSQEYVNRFIHEHEGYFIMDNGIAVIAMEYAPGLDIIIDIQNRYNNPLNKKYDKQVIALLSLLPEITEIRGHKNAFWEYYKNNPSFKNSFDALKNLYFRYDYKISLRNQGYPIFFTEEEIINMSATDKIDMGIELTDEEKQSLPLTYKLKYGIDLSPEEKESLKDSLLGRIHKMVELKDDFRNDVSKADLKELFPESIFSEDQSYMLNKNGIGFEMSDQYFWENIYDMYETEGSYLLYEPNCAAYMNEEYQQEYIQSYFTNENIVLLYQIFKKLGKLGITKDVDTFDAVTYDVVEGVISEFYNELKKYLKYNLNDLSDDVGYEADKFLKVEQEKIIDSLPLGIYGTEFYDYYESIGTFNKVKGASIGGFNITWENLQEFLINYKSHVKTFTELFENTPLIDARKELGIHNLEEILSESHFLNMVNIDPMNEKIKLDLENILEYIEDPSTNPEFMDKLSSVKKIQDVLDELGFEGNEAYYNGIEIKVLNRYPETGMVEIRRTTGAGKRTTHKVDIDHLYVYFQKNIHERKFFKSFDEYIKEKKNNAKM